ncbi:CoA transferase [Arthrobacter sp. RCC_34]|uniref:CoA transferase n=1 Tax=Arthrobacter sp. RCC_34 TaxID=3239230 RepID=UPI0035265858
MSEQPGFPTTLQMVDELLSSLYGDGAMGDPKVSIVGADPLSPSPHRLADVSAAAIAAFGHQIASLGGDRGATVDQVTVRAAEALDQLRAPFLATVNGVSPQLLTDDQSLLGLNDFYRTRDGWVFLLSTYPHLRRAVCEVLDCPPTPEAISEAARHWAAIALEEAVVAAGGVAVAARTSAEWARHTVGQHLAARPVIELERIGDGPLRPLTPLMLADEAIDQWLPLSGVRVVDNTHVIAGPVAGKLLSAFGAEVVHTSRPDRPDALGMLAVTGGGKRNAYADLRTEEGRDSFDRLARSADVVINSYRNVSQFGFDPQQLTDRFPGIITAEVHCWGPDGPWSQRGGFDQLACAATGFSLDEGQARGYEAGRPALPPTHLLNDYLAAYLVNVGVVAALRRRAQDGGSWRVRVNLARVCMWVRDQGTYPIDQVAQIPMPSPSIPLYSVDSPLGTMTEPVIPLTFSGHRAPTPAAPALLGTAPAAFRTLRP